MQTVQRTTSFFFIFPHVLLALVLIGFAPTLYLRFISNPPPIPLYLHLHGMILTLWYVSLVVQAWLIRRGHSTLHRSVGYWLAAYGAVVVAAGLMATLNVVGRTLALGFTFESDMTSVAPELGMEPGVSYLVFFTGVLWGNIGSICAFALLLVAAVLLRQRSDWHKRLVAFASLSILPPALARISRWEIFGGENPVAIVGMLLVLIAAIALYDVVSLRKVHRATLAGFAVILVCTLVAQAVGASAFGQAFVRGLG